MPKFNEWLFGKGPSVEKLPTGTGQQEQFMSKFINQMMQMMGPQSNYNQSQDYLGGLFGQDAFQNFADPFNQQFEQQFQQDIMPRISERFSGMGGNSSGALSSTGFGQALGGAAAQGSANLQASLAQIFSQLQQNAAGQLSGNYMNQAQLAQGYQPFAYLQQPGSGGAAAPILAGAAQGAAGRIGK